MRELFAERTWLWLAGAFALLYAVNLGASELSPIDESRTAVIVRDISQEGNWLLPRTPDGDLSEKPPLHYWIAAVLTRVAGEGEAVLRSLSLIMAIATLLVAGRLALLIGGSTVAALSVGALGSNILFTAWARSAMVDMTFAFFMTAGMAAYVAARLGRLGPWSASALCGACFGLAVLSKGPLGLAIPLAAAGLDVLVETRGRFWKARRLGAAVGLALAIAVGLSLAWYLPAALAGGREFLHTSLLDENVYMPLGLKQGIAGSHTKPPWYYPLRQLALFLPAAALLPTAVRRLRRPEAGPARTALAAWVVAGFLVLMAASNKRWYYLLPLQPAIAILIGLAIAPLREAPPSRVLRWSTFAMGVLLAAGAWAAAGVAFSEPGTQVSGETRLFDLMRDHKFRLAIAAVSISGVGILMMFSSFGPASAIVRSVLLAGLLAAAFRSVVMDPIEGSPYHMRSFAEEMNGVLPPGAHVAVWPPEYGYGLDYYWRSKLEHGNAALTEKFLLVRRNLVPGLPFSVEILDVIRFSAEGRDVALVRRR